MTRLSPATPQQQRQQQHDVAEASSVLALPQMPSLSLSSSSPSSLRYSSDTCARKDPFVTAMCSFFQAALSAADEGDVQTRHRGPRPECPCTAQISQTVHRQSRACLATCTMQIYGRRLADNTDAGAGITVLRASTLPATITTIFEKQLQ